MSYPHLLSRMLTERLTQAPHHTAQSWASHWSINHDLPDKILAAARGQEYAIAEDDDEEEESRTSRRKRPKYRDPSTSGEEDEDEDDQETASVSNEDEDESDDDTPVKKWHEDDMGQKGEPFSEADMYIASKYIAEFPRWHETTSKDRWGPFAEKVFTWLCSSTALLTSFVVHSAICEILGRILPAL